ncbi:CD9 antigen isoform X2 [Amia ocellicauda]|uniref:CD9 antigen isoform X2 n=1 Tax=Amia ocellicauda TaxID=2972642 RepID=UPI0034649ADC
MGLDGCGYCCKIILIIINIIFGIAGFLMLALGLWLRFSSQTRGFFEIDLNTQQFVIGVTLLMVIGALLLLVALLGDCGACSESRPALGVFTGLLVVMIVLEVTAGVLAFLNSKEVGKQMSGFYSTVYLQYVNKNGDASMAITLKIFHNAMGCCGVAGGVLEPFVQETCPEASFFKKFGIPPCPPVIESFFQDKAPLVMGWFLGIAALMVCAVVCSSVLASAIKKGRDSPPSYSNYVY